MIFFFLFLFKKGSWGENPVVHKDYKGKWIYACNMTYTSESI